MSFTGGSFNAAPTVILQARQTAASSNGAILIATSTAGFTAFNILAAGTVNWLAYV